MADLWYYTCEGKQMDPVTTEALKRLAADGVLKPTDLVWREGLPRWVRAGSERELFPDAALPADEEPIPVLTVAPAEPVDATPVADDEPRPRPRRRLPRDDDDEDLDRPRRRKAAAKTGSAIGPGCLVALCVGAGVGLVLLVVVGVVALTRHQARQNLAARPQAIPQFGPNLVPPDPFGVGPPPPIPPGDPKENPFPVVYTVNLNRDQENVRSFVFEKHVKYDFKLRTQQRQPDVDIYIRVGNYVFDRGISEMPNESLVWVPAETGRYEIKIVNLGDHRGSGRDFATTTLTITRLGPVEQKVPAPPPEDPPPPGVEGVPGVYNLPASLDPGREHAFKFQVRKGQAAQVRLRTHRAAPGTDVNLFVYRDHDNQLVGSDTTVGPTGQVKVTAPETEVYRVVVRNVGPAAALCSVSFQPAQP